MEKGEGSKERNHSPFSFLLPTFSILNINRFGGVTMETIRTAVLCACVAALGLTAAENLIPAEKYGKQIRMMLALLLMTAMLKPLTALRMPDIPETETETEQSLSEIAEQADRLRTEAVEESICAGLNRALEEHGVSCRVTGIDLHIQDDGSIIIGEVTVSGNSLTGSVYLREWLGAEIPITAGGETD